MLQVLPTGFQRIRYYGLLGNRYRERKLARCRQLLGMPGSETPVAEPSQDYRDRYQQLTGSSLWQCPVCHQGRMLVVKILAPIDRRPATRRRATIPIVGVGQRFSPTDF